MKNPFVNGNFRTVGESFSLTRCPAFGDRLAEIESSNFRARLVSSQRNIQLVPACVASAPVYHRKQMLGRGKEISRLASCLPSN